MSTDGDGFPAHRNILAAATEHFQKQFCGKWRESSQVLLAPIGVDVSSIALKSVLGLFPCSLFSNTRLTDIGSEYIYVGTLADITTKHDLIELLQVSDYWALTDLFAQVENQLIGTITLGTVHECEYLYISMLIGGNVDILHQSARNWF